MIGKTLAHYEIIGLLGKGGMGEVYKARDTKLGREVALKVLPSDMAEDPERLERFEREARAVAALNHPNVVTLFSLDDAEGQRLLVMEYVDGKSLDKIIPPRGLPLARVFEIAAPMADALAAAHDSGITHRDLKPANVMVTEDGATKVLDFGLAKLAVETIESAPLDETATLALDQLEPLTGEGAVIGTAPYMSPEQLSGKSVDHRTDIFSFGIVLYEMVVGSRPFQGESAIGLASSILKDTPAAVTDVRPNLPRHLGRIISHCLEKDPRRRFQSARDVRNELEGLQSEIDSGQHQASAGRIAPSATAEATGREPVPSAPQPAARRSWRNPVAIALAVITVAAYWWWSRAPSVPPETTTPLSVAADAPHTVAVLPFANLGADETLDYLRVAVPDEIVTVLSRGTGLAVRPFSATSRIDIETTEPSTAGGALGVSNVVTGQYFQEGDRLSLTLESIDVVSNTVVWRDSVVVGAQQLLSLRQAVADAVTRSLMPTLDPRAAVASTGTLPSSEEAYDLYLRSLQMSSDPAPNSEALALVQRSLELDPDYAPAWAELGSRLHHFALYGGGTSEDKERAVEAAQRALDLDPELIEPQVQIIMIDVERGELAMANDVASRLIEQRPGVGRAYFVRAYVLRYAGAIEQAVQDCDTALRLDPRNPSFRSCGVTNYLARRYDRAERFLDLSPDNDFERLSRATIRMRQGRPEDALEMGRHATYTILVATLEPFLEGRPLDPQALQQIVAATLAGTDGEQVYFHAGILAFVGEHETALQLLGEAIDRGFCSYPHTDTDPLFAGLQADADLADDYADVKAAGQACHERFLAEISG